MLPIRGVVFALLPVGLLLAPLTLQAADLVVWWEKGFYPQADEAVAEIVAAFERQIRNDPALMDRLPELEGKVLGCWCPKVRKRKAGYFSEELTADSPPVCHGVVLLRLIEEMAAA